MEEDDELALIRQQRMQQLQSGAMGGGSGGGPEQQQQQEQKRQAMEEQRSRMLTQILTAEARERLSRIALVKAEKARAVEDMILRAAQTGQLNAKVDEARLIQLLEQLGEQKKETKVKIQRRRGIDEDDF